jgi:hypothetical protein
MPLFDRQPVPERGEPRPMLQSKYRTRSGCPGDAPGGLPFDSRATGLAWWYRAPPATALCLS